MKYHRHAEVLGVCGSSKLDSALWNFHSEKNGLLGSSTAHTAVSLGFYSHDLRSVND